MEKLASLYCFMNSYSCSNKFIFIFSHYNCIEMQFCFFFILRQSRKDTFWCGKAAFGEKLCRSPSKCYLKQKRAVSNFIGAHWIARRSREQKPCPWAPVRARVRARDSDNAIFSLCGTAARKKRLKSHIAIRKLYLFKYCRIFLHYNISHSNKK